MWRFHSFSINSPLPFLHMWESIHDPISLTFWVAEVTSVSYFLEAKTWVSLSLSFTSL